MICAGCRTDAPSRDPPTRKAVSAFYVQAICDQSGYLTWDPSKTVCLSEAWEQDAEDYVIGPGDVVMNLTAQSLEDGFMGRVCLARPGDRSLLNQRIGRFCNWSGDVLPEYLFRLFQSSRFQRHAIEMCEGSKVKHIFWPYIARMSCVFRPLMSSNRW